MGAPIETVGGHFNAGHAYTFDAETGTLIVDGARVHPAHELQPGQTEHVHLDFELPAEDGCYQVLVSPIPP